MSLLSKPTSEKANYDLWNYKTKTTNYSMLEPKASPAGKRCPRVDLANVHAWTSQIMYICVRILKCPLAWTLQVSTGGHFRGPRVDILQSPQRGPPTKKKTYFLIKISGTGGI